MPHVRVTEIFASAERSVLAVERLDVITARHAAGAFASLSIRPIAVLVRNDRRVAAYGVDAHSIDLDRLCDENPGLDVALAEAVAFETA